MAEKGWRSQQSRHPGEVLHSTFMRPRNLSINGLARALDVPPNRVSAIVNGERAITADTALRLSSYFGVSALFWMNLQSRYDLSQAARAQGTPHADDDAAGAEPPKAAEA